MPKSNKLSSDSTSESLYDSPPRSQERIQVTTRKKILKKIQKKNTKRKPLKIRFTKNTKTDEKSKKQFPIISQIQKKALIEAEIDKFPFDFKFEHGVPHPLDSGMSEEEDDEDDYYIMDDIYKYQQLPDMSDMTEGCLGFIATALAISFLISVSYFIVVSIDFVTVEVMELSKGIKK